MANKLTVFGENRAVQAGIGLSQAAAAGMYVALTTANPASPDSATLASFAANEISTAGYSRQAVTWGAASAGAIANNAALTFGAFTADPPNVTNFFICDAASGNTGNVLAYGTWTTPKDVGNGDSLQIAIGALTLTIS